MCGFAGWTHRLRRGNAVDVLRAMGEYLAPRGPDDETILEIPDFSVVFRRLAINDVAHGRQPFVSSDGKLVAIVNGEIYNHQELTHRYLDSARFSTRSDCEVVLHLYRELGISFLERLNGIYSIAIWDESRRSLFLARDRLGVKPLYYSVAGDSVVFASELKALLVHPEVPRSIDWPAFAHVPNSSWPFERPAGRSVASGIQGVSLVEPATVMEWTDGSFRGTSRYWSVEKADPVGDLDSPESYVRRYAELIEDSVRIQLMSDVPVGLFLSGGLDSSLIAGIACRHTTNLEAFTLVEPSISMTGDTDAAVRLAQSLELPLHLVRVDQDALEQTIHLDLQTFEYFIWLMDFPLFDVEFLYKHELHRYAKAQRPTMKVILLGQGADEFAGGYSRIASSTWKEFVDAETRSLEHVLLGAQGVPQPYRPYMNGATVDVIPRLSPRLEAWQFLRFGDLAAYNLWHEDRTAAANGMEARVPFLDHRLVEFLCAIPERLREDLFFDKAIERRAAHEFLPSEFCERPKVPLFRRGAAAEISVFALRRRFLRGAFPAFREKYLATSNALFSRRALDALYERAMVADSGNGALYLLLRCMALSIFQSICANVQRPDFVSPSLDAVATPLSTNAVPLETSAALLPDARMKLAPSVRLAVSCESPPQILIIVSGMLVAQMRCGPDWDTSEAARAIFGEDVAVADLARALGVDSDNATLLVETFVNRGWAEVHNGVA